MTNPNLEIIHIALDNLLPYAKNARTHSDKQIEAVANSIAEFGFNNPVLIDGDKGVIAGHCRLLAAKKLGLATVPCLELKHLTATQKRAYIIADNQLAIDAGWDYDILGEEIDALKLVDFDISLLGFDDGFFDSGQDDKNFTEYSKKIDTPIYTPKDEKPDIASLYDRSKYYELIDKINQSLVSTDEKQFLIYAANRHVVFKYNRIAEFYCHASKEMQSLMEDSALVIIDFNKALEQGYVILSDELTNLFEGDEGKDDA